MGFELSWVSFSQSFFRDNQALNLIKLMIIVRNEIHTSFNNSNLFLCSLFCILITNQPMRCSWVIVCVVHWLNMKHNLLRVDSFFA